MDFSELQNKMNLKKKKGEQVKYSYRSAEDILQLFKTLNSGWSIFLDDEIEEKMGKLFIKSTAKVLREQEQYSSVAFAELSETPILKLKNGNEIKQMSDPQWTGAVSSYARKYALQGLFGIADVDVDELEIQQESLERKERAKKRDFISEIKSANNLQQLATIYQEANQVGIAQEITSELTKRKNELNKNQEASAEEIQGNLDKELQQATNNKITKGAK
ncbi:MAG: ERF family protein [Streptococcaceae bacterium]|jgi:hypothetical protein|nr:ERF family protein [Streptococcaceae bacterium]